MTRNNDKFHHLWVVIDLLKKYKELLCWLDREHYIIDRLFIGIETTSEKKIHKDITSRTFIGD